MAQTYVVKSGDSLNKIAQNFGFKDYTAAGITGFKSNNPNLIHPGEVLTIGAYKAPTAAPAAPVAPKPTAPGNQGVASPYSVNNTTAANSYINGGQAAAIASNTPANTPPVKSGFEANFEAAQDVIKKNLPDQPKMPSLEKGYNELKSQYGLDELESELTTLQNDEDALNNQLNISRNAEVGKPVALDVISGRVGEQERNAGERLSTLSVRKNALSRQVQNAYAAIDSIMKFRSADFENAKDSYNTQFSQAMTLYNAISSQSDKATDNARANLSIFYNSIKDGGYNINDIDEATKMQIQKMEMEAGLPAGFYQYVQSKNPKADVLSTGTVERDGNKYYQVLMRDPQTGAITVQSISGGKSDGGSSGGSGSTFKSGSAVFSGSQLTAMEQLLEKSKSEGSEADGKYANPAVYKEAYDGWIALGGLSKDFISKFPPKNYINPKNTWLPSYLKPSNAVDEREI